MNDQHIDITITIDKSCLRDPESAPTHVEDVVYRLCAAIFESGGEYNVPGFLGNGHHAAQQVARTVRDEWVRRTTKS